MLKCFAYYENDINGYTTSGCDVLDRAEFLKIKRKHGGCCAKNCRFYKVSKDQIRTDRGIFYLTKEQKQIQNEYKQNK